MVKYAVIYNTKNGGVGVINIFKTKRQAEAQVRSAKKSPSFKKLGYSRPRIKKERESAF